MKIITLTDNNQNKIKSIGLNYIINIERASKTRRKKKGHKLSLYLNLSITLKKVEGEK